MVDRVLSEIKLMLKEIGIEGEVSGRPKHFYSIYKKMKLQNKTIDQIYDLIAVRIIVDTIRDCYNVLGTIHTKWKPIPGRIIAKYVLSSFSLDIMMYCGTAVTVDTNRREVTTALKIARFPGKSFLESGYAASDETRILQNIMATVKNRLLKIYLEKGGM